MRHIKATQYNSPETMDIADSHLADIDSALNEWLESLPSHRRSQILLVFFCRFNEVRLDGTAPQDLKLSHQSTVLHALYYLIIIFTHRSFISSPSDPVETNSPSLALCSNAARLCSRVLHKFIQHHPEAVSPWFFVTALNAGTILMLNVWLADRRSRGAMRATSVEDIQHCAEVLRVCSDR